MVMVVVVAVIAASAKKKKRFQITRLSLYGLNFFFAIITQNLFFFVRSYIQIYIQ